MTEIEFVAKSKGPKDAEGKDTVIENKGTCKQYENLQEAIAAEGEAKCLTAINQIVKAAAMTAVREQRAPSLAKQIAKALSSDQVSPESKKKLEDMLKKLGVA